MRVLLVYLPHPYLARPDAQVPLGILYLASSLERHGIDVQVRNYTSSATEEALADLPEADLYGITVTSLELLQANRFAALIKEKYPDSTVGLGGPGTFSEEYVDYRYIDFICLGEGEDTILEIVEDVRAATTRRRYLGRAASDLDDLAFPARHLLESCRGREIFAFNRNLLSGGSALVVTSRGCPFSCAFCAAPAQTKANGGVRFRSPKNVAAELRSIVTEFGIREFKFCDEFFTLRKKRVREICTAIGDLGIAWKASSRTRGFDPETAVAMREAGCREIAFGVESFDNRVLKTLRKGTTAEDNARALEASDRAGLKSRVLFMIRTPGQTSRTVPINISWLERVPYDFIACTNFVPIPGSDVWANPDRYGVEIINRNLDDYNFYFYGASEGEDNNLKDTIRVKGRSLPALNDESLAFREYLDSTGRVNKG